MKQEIQTVFEFSDGTTEFDELSRENGFTHWFARDLMKMLGYSSYDTFKKVVNRAMTACMTANIQTCDNFTQIKRQIEEKTIDDYKLSRFACYMIAMNGDVHKPQVAKAQAYFAVISESLKKYVDQSSEMERLIIRHEITDHEKTLSGTAKKSGVNNYALFQNSGYRGMYNMNLKALKKLKGLPENRSPLDFMGTDELAANLFRITQTEAKLRNDKISGQTNAEIAAEQVGKIVRETMKEISGQVPEQLEIQSDIKKVRSILKGSEKEFKRIDK